MLTAKYNFVTGEWDAFVDDDLIGTASTQSEAFELGQEFLDLLTEA